MHLMGSLFSSADSLPVPTISNIVIDNQTESSISVRVTLQLPADGQECVENYTVTDQARGIGGSSNTTVVPVPDLSVCPTEYTFTAVACGGTLPCSNESDPVMYRTTGGKFCIFMCGLS